MFGASGCHVQGIEVPNTDTLTVCSATVQHLAAGYLDT